MSKSYPDTVTMTERAILDEISTIAALPPEEITVEDAKRCLNLKDCLRVISAARMRVPTDR